MSKKVRKRPRIGDILELETPKGLAYLQYTHRHATYGALIRVLPGLFASVPDDLSALAEKDSEIQAFFPLGAAAARNIVRIVGNEPIPEAYVAFPLFRTGIKNPKTGRCAVWWLWDGEREWRVGSLRPDQLHLPIKGIWNDTLLIDRIVKGWKPSDEL